MPTERGHPHDNIMKLWIWKKNPTFPNIHGENTWIFRRLLEATTAGGRQKFVTAFQNFLTKKVSSNFELGRQPSRGRSLAFKATQWFWIEVGRKSSHLPQNIWRLIAISLATTGNNWRLPRALKTFKARRSKQASGHWHRGKAPSSGTFQRSQRTVRESNIFLYIWYR